MCPVHVHVFGKMMLAVLESRSIVLIWRVDLRVGTRPFDHLTRLLMTTFFADL